MFDPITLIAGGVLLAGGWLGGRRNRSSPQSAEVSTPETICSCEHGYGTHEAGGACRAEIEREHNYTLSEPYKGWEWVACPCLTYDGPEPLPRVWTGA